MENNINKIHGSIMDLLSLRSKIEKENDKIKENAKKQLLEEGFIYPNVKYEGKERVSEEEVETNPEKYVIQECLDACKILWGKNIYTYMCSEYMDIGETWIEIDQDNLSEENLNILKELPEDEYFKYYGYHLGTVMIGTKCTGYKAKEKMIKLAGYFKLQDVPAKEACTTIENALINLGYKKEIQNPNYKPIKNFYGTWQEMEEYFKSDNSKQYKTIVDQEKINQPVTEILAQNGYVLDEESGRIYNSKFHYQKHLEYYRKLRQKDFLERKSK